MAHPQVRRATKELHYFDRYWWSESADLNGYREYFPRPEGKIIGEWTPSYMADHWIPPLLAAVAPDARLLVSLRDPVERYLSGLKNMLSRRAGGKGDGPTDASVHAVFGGIYAAVFRGFYSAQLQHLRRHFPRSQILILQFERCVRDPQAELRRTYEFLGVDPDWAPSETVTGGTKNKARASADMPEDERGAIASFLESDVRRLIADYPEIDVSLWPNFEHLAEG